MANSTSSTIEVRATRPEVPVRIGTPETSYTARGLPRYSLEIWHDGISKYQVIKGESSYVVQQKAEAKLNQWQKQWEARQAKEDAKEAIADSMELAEERTREAQLALAELESV